MTLDSKKSLSSGSFVQAHIETFFSDLVRIDLQAALQRSIDTLHLPVKRLQDNHFSCIAGLVRDMVGQLLE